jgi:hypothetical protein
MGKPTASEFHRLVTPTGKASSQASDYCNELLAELMMGRPLEGLSMPWMDRGKTLEEEARAFYSFQTGRDTQPVGFITTDDDLIGCSPDSLVADDGLVEIKCPSPGVHVGYLLSTEGADKKYYPQLQGQLLVTGRAWVDIISYHPEMPEAIIRVTRNEEYIAKLRDELERFLDVLDVRRTKLKLMGWIKEPRAHEKKSETEYDWLGISEEEIERLGGTTTRRLINECKC